VLGARSTTPKARTQVVQGQRGRAEGGQGSCHRAGETQGRGTEERREEKLEKEAKAEPL
jgi:hypothetical protein